MIEVSVTEPVPHCQLFHAIFKILQVSTIFTWPTEHKIPLRASMNCSKTDSLTSKWEIVCSSNHCRQGESENLLQFVKNSIFWRKVGQNLFYGYLCQIWTKEGIANGAGLFFYEYDHTQGPPSVKRLPLVFIMSVNISMLRVSCWVVISNPLCYVIIGRNNKYLFCSTITSFLPGPKHEIVYQPNVCTCDIIYIVPPSYCAKM